MLINGESKKEMVGMTIREILNAFSLSADRVVVEYNGEILDLSTNHSLITQDKDQIEIIGLVGGG